MKEKKVLIVQPCAPSYRRSFFKLILEKSECDVRLCCCEKDYHGLNSDVIGLDANKVDLSLLDCEIFGVKFLKGLKKIVQTEEPDVIVFPGNPRYINLLYLLYLKLTKGTEVIWWGQGWSAGSSRLTFNLRRLYSSLFSGVILYTDKEIPSFRNSFMNRIIALNNGIDITNITKVNSNNIFFKKNDSLNLLFIGRINDKAGLIFLIKAVSQCSNVSLLIIGDGDNMEKCEAVVRDLGISDKVTFLGAMYDDRNLRTHFDASDFFIYGGAVGLSLIHSMAYGLPSIIHSDYKCHMPEVAAFENKVNGFYFVKNDINSLVKLLNKIKCLDGKKYTDMCINSQKAIFDSYNTENMAKRFINFVL